jgi:cytoskeleton protein RodZ
VRARRFFAEDWFFFMAKGTFGERLKREREMREVSIDELTKATRISQRFVDALENEQWDKLPGGVFGRGFVRTIARYLGLGEENLLAEYDMARGEQKVEAPAPYENRIPRPPIWVPITAVLVFLLLVAGVIFAGRYAWHRYAAHRAQQHSSALEAAPATSGLVANAAQELAAPAAASATSSAATTLDLAVSTSAATRVRIIADNALLLDAELPAGETRHFSATQEFRVTAADSSAVLLELNGQAMPALGTPGSSGTIVLSPKDLRQTSSGNAQP